MKFKVGDRIKVVYRCVDIEDQCYGKIGTVTRIEKIPYGIIVGYDLGGSDSFAYEKSLIHYSDIQKTKVIGSQQ